MNWFQLKITTLYPVYGCFMAYGTVILVWKFFLVVVLSPFGGNHFRFYSVLVHLKSNHFWYLFSYRS